MKKEIILINQNLNQNQRQNKNRNRILERTKRKN